MTEHFVTTLGWKYDNTWANRDFYSIGDYTIILHNGNCFISKDDDLYFIESVTKEILTEFTDLVKNFTIIKDNPYDYTLAQYNDALDAIDNFYDKYEEYELEEF